MKIRFALFGIIMLISLSLSAQSSSDWEKYLNATFLPPGNSVAVSQLNTITDENLRQAALNAQGIETESDNLEEIMVVQSIAKNRKQKDSATKKEHADAAFAGAAEASIEKIEISIQHLPEAIALQEQNGNHAELKTLYNRYKNEYPLHPAAFQYASEILKSLPEKAILITQGQLDTYPVLTDQITDQFRKDVIVINVNWLKNNTYRKNIENRLGKSPGWNNQDSPKAMINKLVPHFSQRLFLSMTLDKQLLQSVSTKLYPFGLSFSVQPVNANKHHEILSKIDWSIVLQPNLPQYIRALHANYLAALLVDEKLKQPATLGNYNRSQLLGELYLQTGLKNSAENYLKN